VPDETRDQLAARAARSGRSLQEYLRLHLIEVAERPTAGEVAERIRTRKSITGTVVPVGDILSHRDADKR